MDTEDDNLELTPEMAAEATARDDDLGGMVSLAFAFELPPFPFQDAGGRA